MIPSVCNVAMLHDVKSRWFGLISVAFFTTYISHFPLHFQLHLHFHLLWIYIFHYISNYFYLFTYYEFTFCFTFPVTFTFSLALFLLFALVFARAFSFLVTCLLHFRLHLANPSQFLAPYLSLLFYIWNYCPTSGPFIRTDAINLAHVLEGALPACNRVEH